MRIEPPMVPDQLPLAVHRCETGAFERLVETYEQPLFNYVYRLLQNAADAQEVVQDAFLRAHKALTAQYSEDRCRGLALRPWLYRIGRNLAYNKRRNKMPLREEPLPPIDDNGFLPVQLHAGRSEAERKEEVEDLERALASLPTESRDLITLRFIEELSYAEISKTTGLNEASLRGRVFRSLKLLRDALAVKGAIHEV